MAQQPGGAGSAPRILIVAGHDSSGRAGVDVDRQAAEALGVSAVEIVTAWTVQDAEGVQSVEPVTPAEWGAACSAALAEPVAALKVGLLPGAEHVSALADRLSAGGPPVVVDPVWRASSGHAFHGEEGRRAFREELIPRGVILTPNLPEAAWLIGRPAAALEDGREPRLAACRELLELGAGGVVLKGGHAGGATVTDLVVAPGADAHGLELPRAAGPGLRGTGCRHATALTAALALGEPLVDAAARAQRYVAGLL